MAAALRLALAPAATNVVETTRVTAGAVDVAVVVIVMILVVNVVVEDTTTFDVIVAVVVVMTVVIGTGPSLEAQKLEANATPARLVNAANSASSSHSLLWSCAGVTVLFLSIFMVLVVDFFCSFLLLGTATTELLTKRAAKITARSFMALLG